MGFPRNWTIARTGASSVSSNEPDGGIYRVDRLRCLGNAVVPDQAEVAFRILSRRLGQKVTNEKTPH